MAVTSASVHYEKEDRPTSYHLNQRVRVNEPGNPRVHGKIGTIFEIYDWGVRLALPAATTGEYRCLWTEIEPVNDIPTVPHGGYEIPGYSCDDCGCIEFRRSGTCLTCMNCGKASGGCS